MARKSRKSAIIEAAAELFAAKGFKATTVRDIADLAGVLSGSLYAHISSKEDLYLEIVRQAARDFHEAVDPITKSSDSPEIKLRRMIYAHLAVIAESLAGARVYLDDNPELSQAVVQEARHLRRDYEMAWDAVLQEGIVQGQFGVRDLSLARLFLLSAINGVARWYRPDGRLSADMIAEEFFYYALGMLSGSPGGFSVDSDL